MKTFSNVVSVIFHPIWMILLFGLIVYGIDPYSFSFHNHKDFVLVFVMVGVISIVFPLLSAGMMTWLGILDSIAIDDKKQRIVPLALTGMFYMWLYINIKNNSLISDYFVVFVLGSTISLFIAFVINNFTKISLHAVGIAGLFAGLIIFSSLSEYQTLILNLPLIGGLVIDIKFLIAFCAFLVGLVGSARLYLKAHVWNDVLGGYIVGVLGQIIALRVLF